MSELQDLIAQLIKLAGGQLIGRVRIQKLIYLLDHKGLESGANYVYHHYGPYSEDISDGIEDSKFFQLISENIRCRAGDGAPYSVFELGELGREVDTQSVGGLEGELARRLISRLVREDSTVLELAATIHWLRRYEKVTDWKVELRKRKGSKVSKERFDSALKILTDLQLG